MTTRRPPWRRILLALAVGLSLFQLWQSTSGTLSATLARPIHLGWVLVLTFLAKPSWTGDGPTPRWSLWLDAALALAALYCGWVIVGFDYRGVDHILYGLTTHDLIAGVVFILLLFEATRRAVGWVMVAVGLVFLLYAGFGDLLPDVIANRGFSLERILRFQIFTGAGLFGTPLGIAAGTVFIFVLFGAFLEVTGAGRFFIDLAFAAAGRFRGGPAKASVIASAAMGSISGSAIANTVTTGALTIPMMKKLGYRPEQAGGIEAAASTGGQIMPPIMGAGAFIMADFTNTPYREIVTLSIAPAILYFGCTLLFVHLMAVKLGLRGMKNPPPVRRTLSEGVHFLLPLGLVVALLLLNYSPPLVGTVGCLAVVVTGMARKGTRVGWRTILEGLRAGAIMALPISLACATAGIVVGVIGQTGIGLQFTESVVQAAGGLLWLALIFIAIAALVLGMGLPVTAAYIVISVMAAPALEGLGLSLLVAHMIIFWLSQTSNVTPPIALAAFAGAGVAGSAPMRTATQAVKLSLGFFIVPAMMAYSALILVEGTSVTAFVFAIVCTVALISVAAYAIEGFAVAACSMAERALFAAAGALILVPNDPVRIAGVLLGAAVFALHARNSRGRREAPQAR
ncbi:TRAP transporter permease [Candidatus Palauibacter sp.]|uniref:TRAP transporter permease n=1 Tax=Candidatus Palauibacter sp. TaxID=3101350 RepID=UPI003CC6D160